jgi:hypothetical protein
MYLKEAAHDFLARHGVRDQEVQRLLAAVPSGETVITCEDQATMGHA